MPPILITSLFALLLNTFLPASNIRLPLASKLDAVVMQVQAR